MRLELPNLCQSGNIAGILASFSVLLLCALRANADELPTAPVRTGVVTGSSVGAARVFVGNVEATRRSIVGSPVAGRVVQVSAEEGDAVSATADDADVLVQLEPDAADIALQAAQAAVDVARHELAELTAGPRSEELRRLEADVRRTDALLTLNAGTLKRLESLFERKAVGRSELEAADSARQAAEEAATVARAHLEEAQAGTRKERLAQSHARQKLAELEVRRLEDLRNKHTIRTPFSGYVVRRTVEQGAWVQQGDPVMEIVELDPVEVRVAVPEESVSRITPGMRVRIDVAAVRAVQPDSEVITGTVFRVIPSADVRTRSFPVRIRIDNPVVGELPLLKPGMLARVYLPVGADEEAMLVPRDALVLDGRRMSIFVVESAGGTTTAREVPVTVGSARNSLIRIRPARGVTLSVGMSVVTEGNERLTTGQAVSVLDPLPEATAEASP